MCEVEQGRCKWKDARSGVLRGTVKGRGRGIWELMDRSEWIVVGMDGVVLSRG